MTLRTDEKPLVSSSIAARSWSPSIEERQSIKPNSVACRALDAFKVSLFPRTLTMDQDLIRLVNKLQDTFGNLGPFNTVFQFVELINFTGGELDMPQLVVVRRLTSEPQVEY
jgi:hypothetical protein